MSKAIVNWTRTTLIEVPDKDVYNRAEVNEMLMQGTAFINGLVKATEDRVYDQYGQSGLTRQVTNAIHDAVQVENERQYRLHPINADEALAEKISEVLEDKDFICENDVDTKIEEATSSFVSLEDMSETAESLKSRISIIESCYEELRERVDSLDRLVIRIYAQMNAVK